MPAKNKTQQRLMAIAEHEPGKLYAKNRGLLKMSHEQLHDFASTKGLKREHVRKSAPRRKRESTTHAYDWRQREGLK